MMNHFAEFGDRLLVIFDGHCGLCNGTVRWLLRRDLRDRLRFAASESAKVAGLLTRHGISLQETKSGPTTILVVQEFDQPAERVLERSKAVLALLAELPRPWPAVAAALGWVPRPMLDLGYRVIARWRHRIWGRSESCPLPTAEARTHFL
ncbi:MAG: DCC1-like thiol-disulfide oxidoreductase family protein [Terracidiphilus sp.]|jgi:predicted DCC family thiol-disulfide oxidoreductase YuxK